MMTKKTFKSWLFGQVARNDDVGHLARYLQDAYQNKAYAAYNREQNLKSIFTCFSYMSAQYCIDDGVRDWGTRVKALGALDTAYVEWQEYRDA